MPPPKAIEIRDDVGFLQAARPVLAQGDGEKKKPDDDIDPAIRQIISERGFSNGSMNGLVPRFYNLRA